MFDMGSLAKQFLTSREGQQMIQEYLSSPEGTDMVRNMLSTPEGKKVAGGLLISVLDQLPMPDEAKEILRQALQNL